MKNLSEMNREELLFVLGKSNTLQMEVLDRIQENFIDFWTEVLENFNRRSIDYGLCAENEHSNFINASIDYVDDFIDGMDTIQSSYGFLDEEKETAYNALKSFYEAYDEDEDEDGEQLGSMERMLFSVAESLTKHLKNEVSYLSSKENIEETFLEWYVEEMTGEWSDYNYTVDEDYRLYKMPKDAELMN